MKQTVAIILFAVALAAAAPAFAYQTARSVAPSTDVFEEGDFRLELTVAPALDSATVVTIVYRDAERGAVESIAVDPELVATAHAGQLRAFLAKVDASFLSYVRATLGDRLLHARADVRDLDEAEASIFFNRKIDRAAIARRAALDAEERMTE